MYGVDLKNDTNSSANHLNTLILEFLIISITIASAIEATNEIIPKYKVNGILAIKAGKHCKKKLKSNLIFNFSDYC